MVRCLTAVLLVLTTGCLASSAWSYRPLVLVGFGDSMTAGFGAPPGQGYFDRVADHLRRVLPGCAVENRAESGTTSDQHLVAIRQWPVQARPGIVLITTGGNDVIHDYGRHAPRELAMYGARMDQARPWVRSFQSRLDAMLAALKSRLPQGDHVFLGNLFDPTDGRGDIEAAGLPAWPDGEKVLAAYNEVIAKAPQRHPEVTVIDVHAILMGHGLHASPLPLPLAQADPNCWIYSNVEDPNPRGYAAISQAFLAALEAHRQEF